MLSNLSAETLIQLSVNERKTLIWEHASLIDATHIKGAKLQTAYKLGQVISSVAEGYFQYQIEQDNQTHSALELTLQSELMQIKTDKFAVIFIDWLEKEFARRKLILRRHPKPSNLFELCGANLLSTSNSVTRTLSTTMGRLWEDISDISPYVIVPEFEFGIKISGVDLVILSDQTVRFAQLKTAKGTLTGSQVDRSKSELELHENSLFIAAFDVGSWTFPLIPETPRIAGKEFWEKLHLDYDFIESHVIDMVQKIEKVYSRLAAS